MKLRSRHACCFNFRYIACGACEEWYHVRCCDIEEVLPGFATKAVRSSDIDFFCGQPKCSSKESCCIYHKKHGKIKFPISFNTSDSSNAEDVQNNDEEEIICVSPLNEPEENETDNCSTQSNRGANAGTFENNLLATTGVNLDTLNELSQCSFPSCGTFTKPIKNLVCQMDRAVWDKLIEKYLVSKGNKKYFSKGSWQHIICDYIRQTNPYCTVLFKRHLVYQATKRNSRTDRVFHAVGYCKHQSCKVKKIDAVIKSDMTMEVIFDSLIVNHDVGESCARPIRGVQRDNEKKKLDVGKFSASVEYARRINKASSET